MRYLCLILCAATYFLMTVSVNAEIPQIISYQGKVTDSGGSPVPDGSYTMRFRIMDAPTGANVLWDSGNRTIAVNGGIFSVLLGESPQPAIGLDFNQDCWLLVTFDGINQTPRQRLSSAGYAYMASGLVAGTEVIGSVDTGTNSALKATNTSTMGTPSGVHGVSISTHGRGVFGEAIAATGYTSGIYGQSNSTEGKGVYGRAAATTGTASGVYGVSASANGYGVFGQITSSEGVSYGIYGQNPSISGQGVFGYATATTGYAKGVYGISSSTEGYGVFGQVTPTEGINYGMYGVSASMDGRGVFGWASAASGTTYGIFGQDNSPSGYGVYYSGGLAGTGSKSCIVETSQGPTLLYCQESPENWFEDVGGGRLIEGRAHVELDPLFLETVTIDTQNPMRVFVQLHDEKSVGVAVKKGSTGFEVIEFKNGESNGTFDYRVMAKRKGFEDKRLDYCRAAERDSYLYPELREKEHLDLERENAHTNKD